MYGSGHVKLEFEWVQFHPFHLQQIDTVTVVPSVVVKSADCVGISEQLVDLVNQEGFLKSWPNNVSELVESYKDDFDESYQYRPYLHNKLNLIEVFILNFEYVCVYI